MENILLFVIASNFLFAIANIIIAMRNTRASRENRKISVVNQHISDELLKDLNRSIMHNNEIIARLKIVFDKPSMFQ